MDPFAALPGEVCLLVLSYLPVNTLSVTAGLVCHQWHHMTEDGQLWKLYCGTERRRGLVTKDLKVSNEQYRSLYNELVHFPVDKMKFSLLAKGLAASSTDHASQSILETLNDIPSRFWSSTGSESADSDEYLLYQLSQPICLIRSVHLNIFKAGYQRGLPIYGPRAIQVSIGFGPNLSDMHYKSPIFPVNNHDEDQIFHMTPQLVVGGFMRVDLLGKITTQPGDDLYYLAIRSVRAYGLPIGAVEQELLYSAILGFAISSPAFTPALVAEHKEYEPQEKPEDEESEEDDEDDIASVSQKKQKQVEPAELEHDKELRDAAILFQTSGDGNGFFTRVKNILRQQAVGTLEEEKKKAERKASIRKLLDTKTREAYASAINLIISAPPKEDMRTPDVFAWLLEAGTIEDSKGSFNLAAQFLSTLLVSPNPKLNEHESMHLVELFLPTPRALLLFQLLRTSALTTSERIADFVAKTNMALATEFYLYANIPDKFIACTLEIEEYGMLVRFLSVTGYAADLVGLLKQVKEKKPVHCALQFGLLLASPPNPLLDVDIVKDVLGVRMEEGEWDVLKKLKALYDEAVKDQPAAQEPSETEDDGVDGGAT